MPHSPAPQRTFFLLLTQQSRKQESRELHSGIRERVQPGLAAFGAEPAVRFIGGTAIHAEIHSFSSKAFSFILARCLCPVNEGPFICFLFLSFCRLPHRKNIPARKSRDIICCKDDLTSGFPQQRQPRKRSYRPWGCCLRPGSPSFPRKIRLSAAFRLRHNEFSRYLTN